METDQTNPNTIESADVGDDSNAGVTGVTETEAVAETVGNELDGFTLVGSTTANHEDGDEKIALEDLKPTTQILHLPGVSASIDKPSASSPYGVLRLRIINDAGGRAFVYRQDTDEVTTFKVAFKHQEL